MMQRTRFRYVLQTNASLVKVADLCDKMHVALSKFSRNF